MPRLNHKRGTELPQTKLDADAILMIRRAAAERERLRQDITDRLSNEALAKQLGVHHRTIEKVLSYETGRHIRDMTSNSARGTR